MFFMTKDASQMLNILKPPDGTEDDKETWVVHGGSVHQDGDKGGRAGQAEKLIICGNERGRRGDLVAPFDGPLDHWDSSKCPS